MGLDMPGIQKHLWKFRVSKQWFWSSKNAEAMCKMRSLDITRFVQSRCKMLLWVSGKTLPLIRVPLVWKAKHMQAKVFTRLPTCPALFYIKIKFPLPLPDFFPTLFSLPSFTSKDGNYFHLHIGSRLKSASYLFPKLCPCRRTQSSL